MPRHALKSFGLSALFLAGALSMLATPACVAASEESPCELGEGDSSGRGAGEGACDESEEEGALEPEEEGAGEEGPSEEGAGEEGPTSVPQARCNSPLCKRI